MEIEKRDKDFFDFVEGYGNSFQGYGLVALKFIKKILWVDTPRLFEDAAKEYLLVSTKIAQAPNREANLLLQLLSERVGSDQKIAIFHSHNRILYAFLVRATIPKKLTRVKRNRAFRAVHEILYACHQGTEDLDTCEKLRFLKRNRKESFYALAVHVLHKQFVALFGSPPCSHLAALSYKARRKDATCHRLPPDDFYICEITFESDQLVGVRYRTTQKDNVEYVSPMVVTCLLEDYVDNCHQKTNGWLPFYRSAEWWRQRGGFSVFVGRLKVNLRDLKQVMVWLSRQSSEKYKLMLIDLEVIGKQFNIKNV